MRLPLPAFAAALGLGLAATTLGTAPAATAPETAASGSPTQYAAYSPSAVPSDPEARDTEAFFEAVLESVAEKRAAAPTSDASVTVYYSARYAPSFRTQIARSTQIWNGSVTNVRLQETTSGADFAYYEGNDPRGSYAATDGRGNGYIFLDHQQNQVYDSTRVTAHETGHVLGLPDHYSGPCSELMSGGGPGTSCTNPYPDAAERARVNQLWSAGFTEALDKALEKSERR
ncbi:snapalysin [Streptomyces sp. WMMC905]|uniref:snapalysin n=1 Tax=Streptomyces sp. WMMC905 TaxID=3404123 RepID=UPI003B929694